MTPFAVSTAQSAGKLDPFASRDQAQNLRSQYLSELAGRFFRTAGRALVPTVREANARLKRA